MDPPSREVAGVESVILPVSEIRERISLVFAPLGHLALRDGRASGERSATDGSMTRAHSSRTFKLQEPAGGACPA